MTIRFAVAFLVVMSATAQDDETKCCCSTAERLAYRNAACKAESDLYKGGTIAPQTFGFCVVKLTKRRIADIKDAYLSNR